MQVCDFHPDKNSIMCACTVSLDTGLSSKKEIMLLRGQNVKRSTLMHEKWETGRDKIAPRESQKAFGGLCYKKMSFSKLISFTENSTRVRGWEKECRNWKMKGKDERAGVPALNGAEYVKAQPVWHTDMLRFLLSSAVLVQIPSVNQPAPKNM